VNKITFMKKFLEVVQGMTDKGEITTQFDALGEVAMREIYAVTPKQMRQALRFKGQMERIKVEKAKPPLEDRLKRRRDAVEKRRAERKAMPPIGIFDDKHDPERRAHERFTVAAVQTD
jgi:hypothetical protein